MPPIFAKQIARPVTSSHAQTIVKSFKTSETQTESTKPKVSTKPTKADDDRLDPESDKEESDDEERDPTYVPDFTEEDDEEAPPQNVEAESFVSEKKYIVFDSCLRQLICRARCNVCNEIYLQGDQEALGSTTGSALKVDLECINGHSWTINRYR